MKDALLYALVIFMVIGMPAAVLAGKVAVPEGTPVKLMFDPAREINSGKLHTGDTLSIRLVEDITIGGIPVVGAGANGIAKVTETVAASRPGKPGKIVVSFVELNPKGDYRSKGGAKIKLTGTAEDEGGGRKILSWLFILGLFIKGGQGEIDAGQIYEAAVGETIILESK